VFVLSYKVRCRAQGAGLKAQGARKQMTPKLSDFFPPLTPSRQGLAVAHTRDWGLSREALGMVGRGPSS
jgi:hypothetical protein